MRRTLLHLGLTLSLLLGTAGIASRPVYGLSSQVMAKLEIEGFSELKGSWEAAMLERGRLFEALGALSQRYDAQVKEIEEMKRRGVDNLRRPELEKKLRQAHASAAELDQLQRELAQQDEQLAQLAAQLVDMLDAQRIVLEQQLVQRGPEKKLLTTLNELSAERARYARPLPRFDRRRYAQVIEDAHKVDDPEDMLAMADELEDAESEVKRKLSEVEGRLDDLRTRRKLLQRATSFSREERFFEEGDRGRTFSSRVRASNDPPNTPSNPPSQVDSGSPGRGEGAEAPNSGGGGVYQPGSPATPNANESFGDDEAAGAPTVDSGVESDRGSGGAVDPGLSDSPGKVNVPSPTDNGSGGDPFGGGGRDVIVLNRQADPNVSTRAAEVPDAELDGRIKRLEGERSQLEKQARELERRKKELRRRARQSD